MKAHIPLDAIIIPSGGTIRVKDGSYRSTLYEEGDTFGTLGGCARVEAGAILSKEYLNAIIVTTAKRFDDSPPTHAEIMREELVALGVERRRIILEEKSTTSRNGLTETLILAKQYNWKSILFVTNEYHLPRLQIMWQMLHSNIDAHFISAEDVIIRVRPEFKEVFEKIKLTPSYKKRLESEVCGVEAIRSGTYNEAKLDDKKERLV